jgi:hypothetical protein
VRPTLNQRNGHQNGAHFRNISGQCNMDDSLSKNVTLHLPTCQSSQDAVLQHPLLIVGDVELLHWNTIDICNPTNAPPSSLTPTCLSSRDGILQQSPTCLTHPASPLEHCSHLQSVSFGAPLS